MKKLFIDYVPNDVITLNDEQSRHIIKSLRMKVGDMITVCDAHGYDYGCIIEEISVPQNLKICYKQATKSEPSVKVTLYQGLPKGDKMDDIVQKCVELGINKIVPVMTSRSISRPDEKSAQKKTARRNKISLEAAQQSGRGIVPEVTGIISFKEAVKNDKSEKKIIFYEGGGEKLRKIISVNVKSVSIYIGPEGGFDESEVSLAKENGAEIATLGERILRTQTAPVAALTAIMLLTNNM